MSSTRNRKPTRTGPTSPDQLNPEEGTRFAELEDVVERGLKTFVEVGDALAEIREKRLYRAEHPTFEDYCRARWGFTRMQASRLIQAADVTHGLQAAELPRPANERQARELASLKDDPEEMAEAWKEANATATARGATVTSIDVKRAVQERTPPPSSEDEKARKARRLESRRLKKLYEYTYHDGYVKAKALLDELPITETFLRDLKAAAEGLHEEVADARKFAKAFDRLVAAAQARAEKEKGR